MKQYILLDDVQKLIDSYLTWEDTCKEILKLQSINPEEIIKEMIEKNTYAYIDNKGDIKYRTIGGKLLGEIIQKFKS